MVCIVLGVLLALVIILAANRFSKPPVAIMLSAAALLFLSIGYLVWSVLFI